tara:strand:- start:1269 stop:1697 length:429 start_codon:yes stop_codon:yes gene_type:complete
MKIEKLIWMPLLFTFFLLGCVNTTNQLTDDEIAIESELLSTDGDLSENDKLVGQARKPFSSKNNPLKCVDPDGISTLQSKTVIYKYKTPKGKKKEVKKTDNCLDEDFIIEFYCSKNNRLAKMVKECFFDCVDGSCTHGITKP